MRLKWNSREKCFEAEFQDFQADLAAVKSAGFKTTGPPGWTWYTPKVAVLDKLRKNRPASGLTILEDALVEYQRLKRAEEEKKALLAELKEKRVVKKESCTPIPEGQIFGYNEVEDCKPVIRVGYVAPIWDGPVCRFCGAPVYFYELLDPPTCIYCEIKLDEVPDMF